MKTTDDIAGRALSETRMRNLQWMLLSKIKRGETLRIEGFDRSLMQMLQKRAGEMESTQHPSPQSVTDWMALALFAEDRKRFVMMCAHAEKTSNDAYQQAAQWLNRLMKKNEEQSSV